MSEIKYFSPSNLSTFWDELKKTKPDWNQKDSTKLSYINNKPFSDNLEDFYDPIDVEVYYYPPDVADLPPYDYYGEMSFEGMDIDFDNATVFVNIDNQVIPLYKNYSGNTEEAGDFCFYTTLSDKCETLDEAKLLYYRILGTEGIIFQSMLVEGVPGGYVVAEWSKHINKFTLLIQKGTVTTLSGEYVNGAGYYKKLRMTYNGYAESNSVYKEIIEGHLAHKHTDETDINSYYLDSPVYALYSPKIITTQREVTDAPCTIEITTDKGETITVNNTVSSCEGYDDDISLYTRLAVKLRAGEIDMQTFHDQLEAEISSDALFLRPTLFTDTDFDDVTFKIYYTIEDAVPIKIQSDFVDIPKPDYAETDASSINFIENKPLGYDTRLNDLTKMFEDYSAGVTTTGAVNISSVTFNWDMSYDKVVNFIKDNTLTVNINSYQDALGNNGQLIENVYTTAKGTYSSLMDYLAAIPELVARGQVIRDVSFSENEDGTTLVECTAYSSDTSTKYHHVTIFNKVVQADGKFIKGMGYSSGSYKSYECLTSDNKEYIPINRPNYEGETISVTVTDGFQILYDELELKEVTPGDLFEVDATLKFTQTGIRSGDDTIDVENEVTLPTICLKAFTDTRIYDIGYSEEDGTSTCSEQARFNYRKISWGEELYDVTVKVTSSSTAYYEVAKLGSLGNNYIAGLVLKFRKGHKDTCKIDTELVPGLHDYSVGKEQEINKKWIDGRKIYQNTFDIDSASLPYYINLPQIGLVTSISGFAVYDSGKVEQYPFKKFDITYTKDNNPVVLDKTETVDEIPEFYLTFEYTKQ